MGYYSNKRPSLPPGIRVGPDGRDQFGGINGYFNDGSPSNQNFDGSKKMNSPYSIAQETLGMSSRQRGLMMDSPVRPGPNAYDQGGASKPSVNTQPFNNERLAQQNQLQNISSAGPQAAANAMGQARSGAASQSDAEAKAQLFAAERMSEALYANQSGTALMKMNAIMQSPESNKFRHDIANGKAMAMGMSPDLGGEVATKAMYS